LQNPYLRLHDIKDQADNTAPHLAALRGHFAIIDLLLCDHRTKTCLKNKHGSFPQELLKAHEVGATAEMQQKISHYSRMFFAHATLNTNVKKYALKIYSCYIRGSIDQNALDGTINTIKKEISADNITQDAQLPTQAQLPLYATDEFIMAMLNYELGILGNQKK
jgi:hypothetical protein